METRSNTPLPPFCDPLADLIDKAKGRVVLALDAEIRLRSEMVVEQFATPFTRDCLAAAIEGMERADDLTAFVVRVASIDDLSDDDIIFIMRRRRMGIGPARTREYLNRYRAEDAAEAQRVAAQAAAELGRSPSEPGTARLAADLAGGAL